LKIFLENFSSHFPTPKTSSNSRFLLPFIFQYVIFSTMPLVQSGCEVTHFIF